MNRWTALPACLLTVAIGVAGCATSGGGATDAGWVTLIDGNFNRIGTANPGRAADGAIQADARADKDTAFL